MGLEGEREWDSNCDKMSVKWKGYFSASITYLLLHYIALSNITKYIFCYKMILCYNVAEQDVIMWWKNV